MRSARAGRLVARRLVPTRSCSRTPSTTAPSTSPTAATATSTGPRRPSRRSRSPPPAPTSCPGETAELDFTIDKDAWDPGAIDFKIKVSEPGHNHYVDVHALPPADRRRPRRPTSGSPAARVPAGARYQCIVSAVLKPNLSTPNIGLDITTNTPRTIRTYVSTAGARRGGRPPGVPRRRADGRRRRPASTNHLAHLSPLEAAHEVLHHRLGDRRQRAHRVPLGLVRHDHPDRRARTASTPAAREPGCSNECITKALLHARRPHVTATSASRATRRPCSRCSCRPSRRRSTRTACRASTTRRLGEQRARVSDHVGDRHRPGCTPNTDYYIIVQADRRQRQLDRRAGEFHTPQAPEFDVTFRCSTSTSTTTVTPASTAASSPSAGGSATTRPATAASTS